jgi:glycosyltransferase involved in cell wall biosynthesis
MPTGRPWPKISVITVTRNQGEYLEETIRSVLMQGYPNLEYIVLDGCSTDNTLEVLDRYRKDLTFCVSEPDSGQANALNKGFDKATGDILAWLNSDDCYLPFALFRVALAFDLYKTDLVVGGCQLRKDFSLSAFRTHHSAFRYGEVTDLPLERLLDIENCWQKGEFFYQPEVFWTQDIWNRVGSRLREDLFYSMDYELWVRMAKEGAKLLHIPDALALYRVHERQKTFGDEPPFLHELKAVAEKLKKDYRV